MGDKSLADKAVDIKGKQYVLVSDRVLYFNEQYPDGSISTELLSAPDAERVVVKATIRIPLAATKSAAEYKTFTGHSQAVIGDGYINKTSALENCETSAVGRALAFMGIGVIDSVASADEVKKAETPSQSRQVARGGTKAAKPTKDAAIELKAAKDRTISLLKLLGYTDLKTKAAYEEAVGDLTGLDLTDANLEAINEKLAALVEQKEANQ